MEKKEPNLVFGSCIRNKRKEKGYTLEELSEKSGVSTTAINRMERGISVNPSVYTLEALAISLELSLLELMELLQPSGAKAQRESLESEILSENVVISGQSLTFEQKIKVIEIMHKVIDCDWENNQWKETIELLDMIKRFKNDQSIATYPKGIGTCENKSVE